MYKVVLVDDESLIVEGLRRVVDWAGHNCQVAATAGDAASGAKAIREHRPNILFTDIKMPGEDGLTMLAGLKGEFPRMQIAVLTGYRDLSMPGGPSGWAYPAFCSSPRKWTSWRKRWII